MDGAGGERKAGRTLGRPAFSHGVVPTTQMPIDLTDPAIQALCVDPRLTTHEQGQVGTRLGDASLCLPETF